ncbi:peptidase M16 [Fulvitalea axinellae]|uniref:Peptidase M16 n=1 Tax=Fulvitalea axinellae TaxID=1182444 RepID=A0AAU9CDU0_9BACT|nr:peptidase M16 [Fulvitalea axinellae]
MRKLKTIAMSLAIMLSSGMALAQTKLIEKVTKKGDEVVIPYEKYVLDNGLTLVIHEDHSDPLVHVDVTYHVGSQREEIGKSGFAHFFEHMMFQGSKNVADEEHFKVVSESGGTLNGTTNRDRTNYFQTVPSNQLERMFWLEADRMGFLLEAVTQKKFEVQRATVKNEKGQNYDNAPYGQWQERTCQALYPYGHPYSWLTIGVLEDLDRVDVTDLKKFFLRWYGPNNATLTVGGDVNPKEVIRLAEKYFGIIPRGQEVKSLKLDPVQLDSDRYISYVDSNIRFPALLLTFPTVPEYHKDEAPLKCLAQILGTGQSSFFFKKFVKTRKAIQASVFSSHDELAGQMTMFVLPFPGNTLASFEEDLRATLKEFEKEGVKDEDIQKFVAGVEAGTINSLASVSGKVSQLAHYQTFTGNPNYIQKELDAYLNITKEDVVRVYNKYIKGKASVVLSVLPKGMEGLTAKADNFTPQKSGNNPFPTTDYSGLAYTPITGDKFDRSKKPEATKAPLVPVPDYWRNNFKNGLQIIGTRSSEIPTVTLRLSIEGGHKQEGWDKSKAGIASITAALMNEGTLKHNAEEFSNELDKLGSSVSISAGDGSTSLNISSLRKNLDKTLALAEEILFQPAFPEDAFQRIKKQQIEGIKANKKDPGAIASSVYDKVLFGKESIHAISSSGTEESVKGITLDDVKNFYKTNYAPNISKLVVVGDIGQKEVISKLDFLKNWDRKEVKLYKEEFGLRQVKTKIYLVDKEKAPQSHIRMGYLTGLHYDAYGESFKTGLMNYNLGGAFNSRINLNLREDKGYTYGARSYFYANKEYGIFGASAGVKANTTDSAVFEFVKEIKGFHSKGITADELDFMKNSIAQSDARKYETPGQKAGFLSRIITYDLDGNYVNKQAKVIDKISQKDINALAKKHLKAENMNILVVGDKALVLPGLKRLGYEIIELDPDGNEIGVLQSDKKQ